MNIRETTASSQIDKSFVGRSLSEKVGESSGEVVIIHPAIIFMTRIEAAIQESGRDENVAKQQMGKGEGEENFFCLPYLLCRKPGSTGSLKMSSLWGALTPT